MAYSEERFRANERERWAALQAISIEESIAIGEALLSSELMDEAVFSDDDQPMSLAISLRQSRERAARESAR